MPHLSTLAADIAAKTLLNQNTPENSEQLPEFEGGRGSRRAAACTSAAKNHSLAERPHFLNLASGHALHTPTADAAHPHTSTPPPATTPGPAPAHSPRPPVRSQFQNKFATIGNRAETRRCCEVQRSPEHQRVCPRCSRPRLSLLKTPPSHWSPGQLHRWPPCPYSTLHLVG